MMGYKNLTFMLFVLAVSLLYILGAMTGNTAIIFIALAYIDWLAYKQNCNLRKQIHELEQELLASDNELARRKTDIPEFALNNMMLFCGNDKAQVHFVVLWIKENWHRFSEIERFMIQRNAHHIVNSNAGVDNYDTVNTLWKKVFNFTCEVRV